MDLIAYFRRRGRRSRRQYSGAPRRLRLAVECLEGRTLPSYAITDLGTLGGTYSAAYGINSRGEVAGTAYLPCNCNYHAFLWARGVMHDLNTGQTTGDGYGINGLGQVAGLRTTTGHAVLWSRAAGAVDLGFSGLGLKVNDSGEVVGQTAYPNHGFVWRNGSFIDLGTFQGGDVSTALGVNDRTEVVGQASGRAFLWTKEGGMQELGSLDGDPGSTSSAVAVNDAGQIVGSSFSYALGTTHAVYYSPGGVIDLGSLGGYSSARGLNNLGQVVGDSYGAFGHHAFLTDLRGGPIVDLNSAIPPGTGWNLFEANSINDLGQIVGTGQLPGNNIIHAYLLTPDEPVMALLTATAETPAHPHLVAPADDTEVSAADVGRRLPVRGTGEALPARSLESVIPRSAAVLAGPGPAAPGWADLFSEALGKGA